MSTFELEPPCPVTSLLSLMAAKWTVEILREVLIQPTRTRKFLVHIPGLSMKSLRQRLQELEVAGMILRTQFEGRPLRVEYSITARGREMSMIMEKVKELAVTMNRSTCTCTCSLEQVCINNAAMVNCPRRRSDKTLLRSNPG